MTKYDEVMEKLEVTPEMRARILQNVETQMTEPRKKPNRLRRFAALAACLAILLERIPRERKLHRKRLRRHPEGRAGQLYAWHLVGRNLQLFAQPVCRSAGLRLGIYC